MYVLRNRLRFILLLFFTGLMSLVLSVPVFGGEASEKNAAKQKLSAYLKTAKACEQKITGEALNDIPENRFFVSGQAENDLRLRSIGTQAGDGEEHVFYVIGRDFVPNGICLSAGFFEKAVYSNYLEETIETENETYYVARFCLGQRFAEEGCAHSYEKAHGRAAACLSRGENTERCSRCGKLRRIYTAPQGHTDADGDSVCDRCGIRAFSQSEGSEISAVLRLFGKTYPLSFVCIDEDYAGGMLYLCTENLPLAAFGGYGTPPYENSNLRAYFRDGFQNGFSVNGENLLPATRAESGESNKKVKAGSGKKTAKSVRRTGMRGDYAMLLSEAEYAGYREKIDGGGFLLSDSGTSHGTVKAVAENGTVTEISPNLPENEERYGVRLAVLLKKPEPSGAERIHWNVGDLLEQKLNGESYLFRCIDQNFTDGVNHRKAALFLCDEVIPADTGSEYVYEETADGTHAYVFHPGPIVNFGETSDYKYSRIRAWLKKAEEGIYQAEPYNTGVDYAYTGETAAGAFSGFSGSEFLPCYIGHQKMSDRLFILSVEEAVKYREELWRFEGSKGENPESQYESFAKGYWLRSPLGGTGGASEEYVYAVDLAKGQIRPAPVEPEVSAKNGAAAAPEDETAEISAEKRTKAMEDTTETAVTSTFGVRPAFALPQD